MCITIHLNECGTSVLWLYGSDTYGPQHERVFYVLQYMEPERLSLFIFIVTRPIWQSDVIIGP